MSLFKLCPWWSAQCPDLSASYDSYSIHCCRLGLANTEKDYIVVGSHSGYLSIYQPSGPNANPPGNNEEEEASANEDFTATLDAVVGAKPTDLLLELKLSYPIIGISSGKFVGSKGDGQCQLALLHPMKISIYAVQQTEGMAAHGNQTHLQLCIEHKLRSFAFSMCAGNFGGVKGKEFLCVAHINGALTVFEQDGITYECALAGDRAIPSAVCYVPRVDSFVTVSSAMHLECYRYQDFVQKSGEPATVGGRNAIEPTWSVCVGEFAIDVDVLQISSDESVIMILGQNNLISMTDTGQVRFIKRLDYTPMCFHSYIIGWYWEPNARLVTVVASEHGSVLIYEESKLVWTLQLSGDVAPVALKRSNLDGLPGALLALGETGLVTAGYLGSEPHPFQVPPLNMQRLNVEAAHAELTELEKEIRAGLDFTDASLLNASAERDLLVKIAKSPKLETAPLSGRTSVLSEAIDEADLKKCLVSVSLRAGINLDQIQVYFVVAPPLKCSKPMHMFRQVEANRSERLDTWVHCDGAQLPASLEVKAVVSFINTQSICRILEKSVHLPLAMFFRPAPPVKEDASIKVTISVDGLPAGPNTSVATLFANAFTIDAGTQAIGLRSIYAPHAVTTVVAAKNSNRYRMQTNDVCGLPLVFAEMCSAFQSKHGGARWVVTPPLPVAAVLAAIDEHYSQREVVLGVMSRLAQRTTQMRIVQRRLFVKLDDKKAGSLDGIRLLFARTQQQIADILRELDRTKAEFEGTQTRLSSAIAMMQLLVQHLDVAPKTRDGLCAALVSPIGDWISQGWEEITGATLELLNHLGALKKGKHTEFEDNPVYASTAFDVQRFKRHFGALVDRICRLAGAPPADETDAADDHEFPTVDTIPETSEWVNEVNAINI